VRTRFHEWDRFQRRKHAISTLAPTRMALHNAMQCTHSLHPRAGVQPATATPHFSSRLNNHLESQTLAQLITINAHGAINRVMGSRRATPPASQII
jgi:hypothetical protein